MRRRLGLSLVLLCCSGMLGCSLLRQLLGAFHPPTLTFKRADLLDASLTGITVNLHFDLHNDNPVGLRIAQLAYNFAVEDHPLFAGRPPTGLNIRPDAVSELVFPAHVEFKDLAPTIETFLQKDVARYTASGQVGLDSPVGLISLPISHSGQFDVPKLPSVALQQPTLNNLSMQGAHLTIPVEITNRSSFPLPFSGLTSQVTLSGAAVAAPSLPAQSNLAAHERRVVNLGVDVNFYQAGTGVLRALQNRQVDVGYAGNLNVAGYGVPLNFRQNFNLR